MVTDAINMRWQAEEFPLSLKQLTELEECQGREASELRHEFTYCYLA